MTDLAQAQERWQGWVEETAEALGVDAALVDIPAIHELTKVVAHGLDRPLAPVSSYLLGLAVGSRGADADPDALRAIITAMIPAPAAP